MIVSIIVFLFIYFLFSPPPPFNHQYCHHLSSPSQTNLIPLIESLTLKCYPLSAPFYQFGFGKLFTHNSIKFNGIRSDPLHFISCLPTWMMVFKIVNEYESTNEPRWNANETIPIGVLWITGSVSNCARFNLNIVEVIQKRTEGKMRWVGRQKGRGVVSRDEFKCQNYFLFKKVLLFSILDLSPWMKEQKLHHLIFWVKMMYYILNYSLNNDCLRRKRRQRGKRDEGA